MLNFIVEHLPAEARANATVNAARCRNFDNIYAAPNLFTYSLTTAFNTIAQIVLVDTVMQIFRKRKCRIHMSACRRNRARPFRSVRFGASR